MILLDTNVIAAVMLRTPDPTVVGWLNARTVETTWTTAVTVFEIQYGLAILAEGRRRRELEAAFAQVIEEDLGNRVLPFDRPAAMASARFGAEHRAAGRPVEIRDVQIAGIAIARKATLATRNLRHFDGTGVSLVDPWSD